MDAVYERERSSRRIEVLGRHEQIELPITAPIRFPQVRASMNPSLGDIKESIKTLGLINPIDVARMDEELLQEYIEFVNTLWKTDLKLEDYLPRQQADGYFYVVVAGHTRVEAISQLQAEAGEKSELWVLAKVHPVASPQDLLGLQLAENFHSTPSKEQQAIALVETYYGGLGKLWRNKTDFLRQSKGQFSPRMLREALAFASLPADIRDFVFAGKLPYVTGVAIGIAGSSIMDYVAANLGHEASGDDLPENVRKELDRAYRLQVVGLIQQILNRRLNGPASTKFIKAQVDSMRRQTGRLRGEAADEQAMLFEDLARTSADMFIRQRERELREALQEMKNSSIEDVTRAIRLQRALVGDEGIDDLEHERATRREHLGEKAVTMAWGGPMFMGSLLDQPHSGDHTTEGPLQVAA